MHEGAEVSRRVKSRGTRIKAVRVSTLTSAHSIIYVPLCQYVDMGSGYGHFVTVEIPMTVFDSYSTSGLWLSGAYSYVSRLGMSVRPIE